MTLKVKYGTVTSSKVLSHIQDEGQSQVNNNGRAEREKRGINKE